MSARGGEAGTFIVIALIFAGLLVTLPTACVQSDAPSTPGGQASSQIAVATGRGGSINPPPVEIWQDNQLVRTLAWDELEGLQQHTFSTGLDDEQTGYLLIDVLAQVDITKGKSVTLYGGGNQEPTRLGWKAMANPQNQIIMGLTHKGTLKIVAGNFEFLNRDRWVRHLTKIEVTQDSNRKSKAEKKRRKKS